MQNVDVILLTNSATERIVRMTRRSIISMQDAEDNYKFNVTLMESGRDCRPEYADIVKHYVVPKTNFNYNKFLNLGFEYLTSDWVVISNNDVGYERFWFDEIMKINAERPDIQSFSPKDPFLYMKYFDGHFLGHKGTYYESYNVHEAVMGWCLVIKREALEKIRPFDELFDMYYQDNDYAEMLKLYGIKHALVRHSIACHLESCNVEKLDEFKMNKMKVDGIKFTKKWNK